MVTRQDSNLRPINRKSDALPMPPHTALCRQIISYYYYDLILTFVLSIGDVTKKSLRENLCRLLELAADFV